LPYVFSDINYSALAVCGLSAHILAHEVPKLVAVNCGVEALIGLHVEPALAVLTEVTGMTMEKQGN
jgi:hypothetical protein